MSVQRKRFARSRVGISRVQTSALLVDELYESGPDGRCEDRVFFPVLALFRIVVQSEPFEKVDIDWGILG